jgi:regulator of protease activity HflC (stomatin/prohibitin superfamily)
LRTGKYAVNPHLYQIIKVPTAIVRLNWAEYNSAAHALDKELKPIGAKSREGFDFSIDLEVQIHVPDTMAPRVISRVGSMASLVQELLQGAVGNHFRNELQSMEAVKFIAQRNTVQKAAEEHVKNLLATYEVETIGVFIQDVRFPAELTKVLKEEEIARREVSMYEARMGAEKTRAQMERASGEADMQKELANAELGIQVETSRAAARKATAEGEAAYISQIGQAQASAVEAEGLARAKGYEAQVDALGQQETTRVNIARELAQSGVALVPHVYAGGTSGGSMVEALIGLTVSDRLGSSVTVTPSAAAAKPAAIVESNGTTDDETEARG